MTKKQQALTSAIASGSCQPSIPSVLERSARGSLCFRHAATDLDDPSYARYGSPAKTEPTRFNERAVIVGITACPTATRWRLRVIGICFFLMALLPPLVYACPMCTELIEHGKDALQAIRFGNGIAWSMLVMFCVPLLLLGGISLMLVRSYRKSPKLGRHEPS